MTKNKFAKIILAGLMLAGASQNMMAESEKPQHHIQDLAWISGDWIVPGDPMSVQEIWTPPGEDAMVGLCRFLRNEKLVLTEMLTIEQTASGPAMFILHYGSELKRRHDDPIHLLLTDLENQRAVFSNQGDEFPKEIVYHLENEILQVSLIGENPDGTERRQTFPFQRNSHDKTSSPTPIFTQLMFEGDAEEAMNLYISLFSGSEILSVRRYGPGEIKPEGTFMLANFHLRGHHVTAYDSPMPHNFTFTPSSSFFVDCKSEEELDRAFEILSEGGEIMMPPGNYGFSEKYTWISDRYGVSWQLNWNFTW